MDRKVVVIIPPGAPPKFCKSCGHAILWGHTPTQRKPSPADAVPINGLYYSHFETCQNAAQHSKPKPAIVSAPRSNAPPEPELLHQARRRMQPTQLILPINSDLQPPTSDL